MAFSSIAALIPEAVPIILESLIDQGQSDINTELQRARDAFSPAAVPGLKSPIGSALGCQLAYT
jgi:hypothetical protein